MFNKAIISLDLTKFESFIIESDDEHCEIVLEEITHEVDVSSFATTTIILRVIHK